MPVKWQEDLLAKENPKRSDYIQALKKADQSADIHASSNVLISS